MDQIIANPRYTNIRGGIDIFGAQNPISGGIAAGLAVLAAAGAAAAVYYWTRPTATTPAAASTYNPTTAVTLTLGGSPSTVSVGSSVNVLGALTSSDNTVLAPAQGVLGGWVALKAGSVTLTGPTGTIALTVV